MKKQQNSKKLLFEMMEKINPGVNFNENAGYKTITKLQMPVADTAMEMVAEFIDEYEDENIKSSISSLRAGDNETLDFDVPIEDKKYFGGIYGFGDDGEKVPLFDPDRIVGKLSTFVDYGKEQKGYMTGGDPWTEPIPAYWGADVGLEELSLIDDKNKIIYAIPKESEEFKDVDDAIERRYENLTPDDVYPDPY
jgi:hypothetical protein